MDAAVVKIVAVVVLALIAAACGVGLVVLDRRRRLDQLAVGRAAVSNPLTVIGIALVAFSVVGVLAFLQ